ncbi:MraZ protein [Roseivirga ehrenbergii]|uniref:Transcriptional regulator MraZ n=3 Tax=Roseivirga TaxID=290180 RepID=A0A0L8AGK0_9BACT|nr:MULTISPECIES: division/cell wall cluster transcriptional repressor MraZ [Roseivirga]KOF01514.1 protein MraZ [Roseivirga seohaensis subsp. aquiponti]KYG79587.1 division/cell wall cluster transcriptional repressor MraZ [Roseivirga ehrenbergii]KYG85636.1 division/cell wall cluster transcriptional repressor MraZ [Roseivirga seohaensis]TCL01063.1 MraZ protein [Roseivirga ehrenbergii]
MAFFTSEYDCKLDVKGRLALPSKVRAALPDNASEELVLRRGFEPCLVLYPMLEYKKIYAKIKGLSEFSEEYRRFQRTFFRGNVDVELDGAGRINIPKKMMEYAGLEKEVVLVGLGNRIEIWNPDQYEEYLIQDASEYSKMAEKFLADE